MLREANLSNKKFQLMPLCGMQVLTVAPVSVLDRKGNIERGVERRLNESVKEAGIDLRGVTSMLSNADMVAFLKENSGRMEKGMSQVITELHSHSPSPSPQPSLGLAARATATPKLTPTRK